MAVSFRTAWTTEGDTVSRKKKNQNTTPSDSFSRQVMVAFTNHQVLSASRRKERDVGGQDSSLPKHDPNIAHILLLSTCSCLNLVPWPHLLSKGNWKILHTTFKTLRWVPEEGRKNWCRGNLYHTKFLGITGAVVRVARQSELKDLLNSFIHGESRGWCTITL